MAEDRRWALVVGASRGLGLGLAAELRRRGWNVVATARGEPGELRLRELAATQGPGLLIEHLDINDDRGIAALRRRFDRTTSISSSSTPGSRRPAGPMRRGQAAKRRPQSC